MVRSIPVTLLGRVYARTALWIHGHTHRCVDVAVRGTRVVSNPRGYPHEPVDGFDAGLVLEI